MSNVNLKSYAAADTAEIELLDGQRAPMLTPEKEPVTVTVYGPGSKQMAAAIARSQARQAKLQRIRKGREATPEERTAETAELLADITVSMSGIEYEGLQGREMFTAIYNDTTLGFVTEQVNRASVDWANFTTPSSKS